MRFEMRETADGSLTLFDRDVGECYKSQHAAATEVEAVFFAPAIRENPFWGTAQPFRVLELGFGLGTNFSQLANEALPLEFTSIERDLAGAKFFTDSGKGGQALKEILRGKTEFGALRARIIEGDFFAELPKLKENFEAIFFDPFSPKSNPEAWTEKLFRLCFDRLIPGGRLVTYSVSRQAKDAAVAAGFEFEKRKLPKVLNKRGSLLAIKPYPPLK